MENVKEGAMHADTSGAPQQQQSKGDRKRYWMLMAVVVGMSLLGFALMLMQYAQNQALIEAYNACDPNIVCRGLCAVGNVFG